MLLDEIKARIASGTQLPMVKEFTSVQVCDIGDGKVVKYGRTVRPGEGLATQFISENTSIPVPKIFAVVTEESDNGSRRCTYIVEEKIHGIRLLDALPTLDSQSSSDIARQLSDMLAQLSSLDKRGSGLLGVIGGSFKETGFFGDWARFNHGMPRRHKSFSSTL